MSTEQRPDPDALLAQVEAEGERRGRGQLKVFFGYAPGVGKTYAMLEAARKEAAMGRDVLVGYVEPHLRPETQALVLGLDLLARRKIDYHGATLQEFDLEAAIERRPSLIVVDELAHTNAPGSTHAKRWQDAERLLDAGIDVYTTINVQHLESLNDVIARITGVSVRETVPDSIFDGAHEVELVDIAPDDLIERLREGKVYVPGQAARAVENFFRKGNLIALRELALRRTAERVGAQVDGYRQAYAIDRTWQTNDRLLVCVSPSPLSGRLVRAARRMAASLRAPWTAVHVETPSTVGLSGATRERLNRHLQLAERLGAQVVTLSGVNVAEELLHYARRHNVSRIVVGKPREPRWKEVLRGSFVYDLTRKCGDIDIYVISGEPDKAALDGGEVTSPKHPVRYSPFAWAMLTVAACTLIGLTVLRWMNPVNVAMVYLIGVVLVSRRFGQGPSALSALLGVLAFDFFFIPPELTFAVHDTEYVFTFAVMLATGLVISTLTGRIRAQAELARRREERTASLYSLSRTLSGLLTVDDVAHAVAVGIADAADAQVVVLIPAASGELVPRTAPGGFVPSDRDLVVARWVYDHRQAAGLGTDTLPGAEAMYLPLVDAGDVVGVLGLRPLDAESLRETGRLRLIDACAGQAAVALGRVRYSEEAQRVRVDIESERMKNALLSSVSHDLRTPLAAIAGAGSALLDGGDAMQPETRRELLETVVEEADGLNRLVGNLLDTTRLQAGALAPQCDWQSLEELLGIVTARLARPLKEHPLSADIPHDLPLFSGDGQLVQQVLRNLLENAAKYSPAGSHIEVTARARDGEITVEVADRGPGLPAGEEDRVFEKFRRVPVAGRRMGAGLGLAICRGVVQLHGGRIWAENRPGGGAVFRFTLPLGAGPAPEVGTDR